MGKIYDGIDDRLAEFLHAQPVFFVATAPSGPDGHVNVSPKGLAGSFAVLDPRTVAYLDLTGSGAETIAHLRENGRVCLMFCAFAGPPKIVRLHGRGEAVLPGDPRFPALAGGFVVRSGLRSVVRVAVERISDSCGFGVPSMAYQHDREQLPRWAEQQGAAALAAYRREMNSLSVDGLPAFE
jgi:predicted pyridoxine 5'-phosphate oxidase superfamily flavin-nucleotide-binding protein